MGGSNPYRRMARARQLPISDLILALFGSQSKDTCQPSLAVLEQRGWTQRY
jgi:hypothetical protein